jgi:hypothetical protein
VYGPQEATVDDVMTAIATASQATREHNGYTDAWARVADTDDNHVRAVLRRAGRETNPEAGQ